MVDGTPQKWGVEQGRLRRSGEANKEQKLKTKNKSKSVGANAPASHATQLPKDFQPNEQHHRLAKELGVDLQNCFASFCDHHASKGNTFKDWSRALNTWLRNEVKFNRGRNGAGNGNRAQQQQDSNIEAGRKAIEILKRRREAREDNSATDRPGGGVQGDIDPGVHGYLLGKPI